MKSIKSIISYYIENKNRFQFEKIMEKEQIKQQIILTLQQVEMLFRGNLSPRQTMKVINGIQDQSLDLNYHDDVDFRELKKDIMQYRDSEQDNMIFTRNLINEVFKKR